MNLVIPKLIKIENGTTRGIKLYYKKDTERFVYMTHKLLINIPDSERENGRTKDSIKYKKDCVDFQSLRDGTMLGDHRYCNLSLCCRQIDVLPNGKVVPMAAHILPISDETGQVVEHQLFCNGLHDLRALTERSEDPKVQ